MWSLLSVTDVQSALREHIKQQRKHLKLSRQALAERSTVPASTIKKFETTGQISLRQFLLLWQSVDELSGLQQLTQTKQKSQAKMPTSIDEVLNAD
ncbi:MAG: XRE family transcriptional regulator [Methylomonas sp.]